LALDLVGSVIIRDKLRDVEAAAVAGIEIANSGRDD
jgi:histidinol phosphatase-like enzyme